MRSLFVRVFLSFWLAMTLIGTAFALIYVWSPPAGGHKRKASVISETLRARGTELIRLIERGERAEAEARAVRLREQLDIRLHLFRRGEPVPGPFSSTAEIREVARQTAGQGTASHRSAGDTELYAIPLRGPGGWTVVGELSQRPRLVRWLEPQTLPLRLLILVLVSGLVCYVLARTIARPIRVLQHASQKLAAGDLSARAGQALGQRRDETGELGRDFDRMADRIQELLDAQQRLLRDISHELRSPLARLSVALGLARKRAGEEATSALDRIELEAERLNQLIGELTTLTLLESGAESIGSEEVDLTALLEQVVRDANFEAQARRRQVTLTGAEPLVLRGSAELLRRALENVVRNGLRFTAEGTAVQVRLERAARADGALARIEVRDHGPGVPETALQDIFRPFFRVAAARERESGGVGLGLAISARAVALHGGQIRARNAAGGGLEVELALPLSGAPLAPRADRDELSSQEKPC